MAKTPQEDSADEDSSRPARPNRPKVLGFYAEEATMLEDLTAEDAASVSTFGFRRALPSGENGFVLASIEAAGR